MGKAGDEQHLPSTSLDAQGTSGNTNGCCLGCSRIQKLVSLRCVFVLMLGVAVILSAVFWLPFFHFKDNKKILDLDYQGHDVVASFMLKKPVSFLQDNKLQLESDIFDEMSFSNTKVDIISIEPAGSNISRVVFAVESDVTTQSLIRAAFVSLITHQSYLHLTSSLFGEPFSFEVLKFRGGITASPVQKAYLMQRDQILFNFTLSHFSIDQSLDNFNELSSQLKTGLRLDPHENLYLRLTNLKGSTVTPPTIIQSQVLLVVGIPSQSRLKQLAQTITSSHAKNLGLNNTVFGRVKQVRLSSILEHSLGNDGNSPSPSPSPTPPQSRHHHHHHHRHHHEVNLAPSVPPSPSTGKGSPTSTTTPVPAPAPAPQVHNGAEPPGCRFTFPWKHNKHPHAAPTKPPVFPPHAAPSQAPKISTVPVQSPLPNVAYAQSQPPPSKSEFHARSPDIMPLVSPSPSPSSAWTFSSNIMALPLFILLVWCL